MTRSLSPPQRKSRRDDSPSPSWKRSHDGCDIREMSSKRTRTWKDEPISFEYDVLEGIEALHNDAIVINIKIHNYLVKRVLLNNGRGADILYYAIARMMGITDNQLIGFGGYHLATHPRSGASDDNGHDRVRSNRCPISLQHNTQSPSQNILKIIGSSPHLKVKFPTLKGRRTKGDRSTPRECYNTSLTEKAKSEAFTMQNLDTRNELREAKAGPTKDLTEVRIRDKEPNKVI